MAVPCAAPADRVGEIAVAGRNLRVAPLTLPAGAGARRKAAMPAWIARNARALIREIRRADAVHTPIPGDIGTIGMVLAFALSKPLFVRHCGNWAVQRTGAERFWRWFMERFAGGRNVMLATGGGAQPPSTRNPAISWIFATSLSEQELRSCRSRPQPPRPEQGRLIIACRQEKAKGTGVVIESLRLLSQDFPAARLDVVGDGSAREEFEALAAARGVADRITFHGKVDHQGVIRLLQQADLFCYPTSASEGFPKVVLEALACGLPVITTRVSVLPFVVSSGCGLLLDAATPAALVDAVRACLMDSTRYCAMSARAIETAGQYSLERWRDTIATSLTAAWGELRSHA